jgi:hypothetical protein
VTRLGLGVTHCRQCCYQCFEVAVLCECSFWEFSGGLGNLGENFGGLRHPFLIPFVVAVIVGASLRKVLGKVVFGNPGFIFWLSKLPG